MDEKVDSTGRLADFSAASATADAQQASSGGPRRRSIFSSYWKKCDFSPSKPATGPSYLGVYSFATTSPTCVSKSLSLSPTSILRRKGSGRAGSLVCPPPLLLDSTSAEASEADVEIERRRSVHFDPRVTIRESLDSTEDRKGRMWYDERDICRFLLETVVLSQNNHIDAIVSITSRLSERNEYDNNLISSKRNLSPVSIREHRDIAASAGIKKPVVVKKRNCAQPVLSGSFLAACPDDIIVHEGSKSFFLAMANEVKHVLIVEPSLPSSKLAKNTMLSMFPHARIDVANSGEASLDLIGSNEHQYDIIIAEERLDSIGQLSGSELLRLLRQMQEKDTLMIGMSSSMSEDCETLTKRGTADVLWGKVRHGTMTHCGRN